MKFNYKRKNGKKLKNLLSKKKLVFVLIIMDDYFRAERKASKLDENEIDAKQVVNQQIGTNVKVNTENISNWNEENVRDFLIKNNLIALVPLCDGINGEELCDLYAMCKANSASMYRSLKFELLHGYHRILPISTFLRFFSRMRAACADGLPSKVHQVGQTHENPFPDDE